MASGCIGAIEAALSQCLLERFAHRLMRQIQEQRRHRDMAGVTAARSVPSLAFERRRSKASQ